MNTPFYNLWGAMYPYFELFSVIIVLVIFGLLSWYVADMRSILKGSRQKDQLSIEGNWKELENYFESAARPRRLFVWFYRRFLLPGNVETQHAMFLFKQGRLEEALAKNEEAIRRKESKPWIFGSFYSRASFNTLCAALRGQTLILGGLGRYDEARKAAAKLEKLTGGRGNPNSALALLEYRCGHLDEALRLAQAASSDSTQLGALRGVMALCYTLKGDFEQAIQALSYAPIDIVKLYSPAGLEIMSKTPEGVELLEVKRRKLAGFFPPSRFIKLARVYLAMEDFANADRALGEAEKSLGPESALQVMYYRLRACSFAGQGKSAEAEASIERLRAIAKECSKRSALSEIHFGIGRAYLYLKRFNEALAELNEAQKFLLHPIEKHAANYWMAKAHEGAGNRPEAIRFYQIVAQDPIPSRLRKQATDVLAAEE